MRYIIAAAAFALITGIALGFVFRGGAFEAEAKPPPPVGRLIELGTLPAGDNETVQFPLVDVGDCSQTSVLARSTAGGNVKFSGDTLSISMDGTTIVDATSLFLRDEGDNGATALLGAWPFVQVRVKNFALSPTEITASIWCAP